MTHDSHDACFFVGNFLKDNSDQWFRKARTNCSSLVIAAIPENDAFLSAPFRKDWFETNLKDVDIVDVLVWVLFLIGWSVDVRRYVGSQCFFQVNQLAELWLRRAQMWSCSACPNLGAAESRQQIRFVKFATLRFGTRFRQFLSGTSKLVFFTGPQYGIYDFHVSFHLSQRPSHPLMKLTHLSQSSLFQ